MQFVNQHLDKLGLSAEDMESSFSDGCFLIMLIGQLDGFFVPLHSYYMPGTCSGQKLISCLIKIRKISENMIAPGSMISILYSIGELASSNLHKVEDFLLLQILFFFQINLEKNVELGIEKFFSPFLLSRPNLLVVFSLVVR